MMQAPDGGADPQSPGTAAAGAAALDEFALIAHEIRGPLSLLFGHLELARDLLHRDVRINRRILEGVLERSLKSARELSTLTAQLIEARRISSGFPLDDVVDLNEVMHAVADALPSAAADRVTLVLSPTPTLVAGHRLYLSRVAANLVDNALKYSPDGAAVTVATSSGAESDETTVALTVTDTGEGMAEEELPRLLGRFERGSESTVQRTPGSGLGLYIVGEIVRNHGGEVKVRSTKGAGSTITVVLPRAA
jgi:signal transduction histidine kinase